MAGNLTYQQAGVDTRKAAALVGDIGSARAAAPSKRGNCGARSGFSRRATTSAAIKEPVMMTGCDGVGTKLELLLEHDLLETAGKDLVAMSVNDILTTGGDPLLFLDYIGIAALDEEKITRLISGHGRLSGGLRLHPRRRRNRRNAGHRPRRCDRAFRFLHRLRGETRPHRPDHRGGRRRADRLRLRQHPRQRLVAGAARAQRISRRSHRRGARRVAETHPPLSRCDARS